VFLAGFQYNVETICSVMRRHVQDPDFVEVLVQLLKLNHDQLKVAGTHAVELLTLAGKYSGMLCLSSGLIVGELLL